MGLDILPADAKMCTRCPCVLSLQYDAAASTPLFRFDDIDDFDVFQSHSDLEVQSRILEMQQHVAEDAPVSATEIRLTVRSDKVPTLTLIDLPGRVRAQVEHAVEIDLLIESYIASPKATTPRELPEPSEPYLRLTGDHPCGDSARRLPRLG